MLSAIKDHPYLFGGTALAAVLVIMYMNSGSASPATTGSSGDLAASEALQAAQLQANGQSQQYATALQAQTEQDSTQVALAKIQADTSTNANTLAAAIASKQLDVQQSLGAQSNTLSAQVHSDNNATQVRLADIGAASQTAQLATVSAALTANNQAQIDAQRHQQDVEAWLFMQSQQQHSSGGWLSRIFG